MLHLKNLKVTQNAVRNVSQLRQMQKYVEQGGIFNTHSLLTYALCKDIPVSPLIHIALVEGQHFVHDGHHRAIAIHRAKRSFLFNEEYEVVEYSDYDYYTLSLERNWVTPFNLRTQCRKPDFSVYKDTIKWFLERDMTDAIEAYSEDAAYQYKELRRISTITELSEATCFTS